MRAFAFVLLAACGGRVAPLPEPDGYVGVADGGARGRAPQCAQDGCQDLCADLLAACAGLPFSAAQCRDECQAREYFDECAAGCTTCDCFQDCYRGERLNCAGFCAYAACQECDRQAFPVAACAAHCGTAQQEFAGCIRVCEVGDCGCLNRCLPQAVPAPGQDDPGEGASSGTTQRTDVTGTPSAD